MDIELLQKALDNDDNLNIVNTNIKEIKKKKNDILKELNLNKEYFHLLQFKLKEYRYIDNIKDLKYSSFIRWISLSKIEIQNLMLHNPSILTDIKILDKGIALVLRTFNNKYITIYLNENLIFQKLNNEEKIILKTIDYLNK